MTFSHWSTEQDIDMTFHSKPFQGYKISSTNKITTLLLRFDPLTVAQEKFLKIISTWGLGLAIRNILRNSKFDPRKKKKVFYTVLSEVHYHHYSQPLYPIKADVQEHPMF